MAAEMVLGLTQNDVADYVSALFLVYITLIFARILMSWIPRMPANRVVIGIANFITETTDPYLNVFRRILPPLGGSSFALDLSPMIGLFLLFILQALIVGAIST